MCNDILLILGENGASMNKKEAKDAAISKVASMSLEQAQEVFNASLCTNKASDKNCPLMTALKNQAGVTPVKQKTYTFSSSSALQQPFLMTFLG